MNKVIVIAEAGVNHNGDVEMAKQLIDVAAEAGVDYVKFQTFHAEKLVSHWAEKADYQKKNTGDSSESQLDMLRKLELSPDDHRVLMEHCRKRNVKFLSTAFDAESVEFLASLHLDYFKVPSGEITNFPFLRQIAQKGTPVLLSTGMSTLKEITQAIEVLTRFGLKDDKITLLHCNTDYPTAMADVNLSAMPMMSLTAGMLPFGYSDHTLGIEVPIAAVALGATVIEKHFTLDHNLPGPDHRASLEPDELKAMVKAIRNIELALGDSMKQVMSSETKNRAIARKSIVAACPIVKGELLTEENLTCKRPGDGLSPMLWEKIIGQTAKQDYAPDDQIEQ
ncbi:MAG: N-acetylneuraminate synthase [Bacteroides sp.]